MSFIPEIKTISHITLKSIQNYISNEHEGDEAGQILWDNVMDCESTIGVNYATIMTIPNFINVMKYTMKWNLKDYDFTVSKKKMKEVIDRLTYENHEKVFVWVGGN